MNSETPTLFEARAKLVSLIAARGRSDRYADLRSWWRGSAAQGLIYRVYHDIADWELRSGKRVRRRLRRGPEFTHALCRFVGDLLRARTGENASGRIYRSLGKTSFDDVPVTYDEFMGVLDGLKALGFVGHEKGQTRYRRTDEWGVSVTLPGRASRFWATDKLVGLAETFGIHQSNVGDHFRLEPPHNPLVLRDYAVGKGVHKERGPIIRDYKRTALTKRLLADVRELNDFLSRCEITGGEHQGYTRNFNNASWRKGGRLYSVGGGYQHLAEKKRVLMTMNGDAVSEIDIKASFLTIYHARLGVPLEPHIDPYVHAGIHERAIAKSWVVHSFGKSSPQMRWPSEAIKDYQKETGLDLRKVAKASEVAKKMLQAFPALRKLERYSHIWADLQHIESEAIVSTMLILMRKHGVPSLSMHDGIIVPWHKTELTKTILSKQYREFVGVEPMLDVEPERSTDL